MTDTKEAHLHSIIKAASCRLCAAIATPTIAFVFTRKLPLSLAIGGVEALVKIIFYYLHERVWSFIKIGQQKYPLSSLQISKALEQHDIDLISKNCRGSDISTRTDMHTLAPDKIKQMNKASAGRRRQSEFAYLLDPQASPGEVRGPGVRKMTVRCRSCRLSAIHNSGK